MPDKIELRSLKDWTDWDRAAFHLGAVFGLWEPTEPDTGKENWNGLKWVFWTSNPLGEMLHEQLLALARAGVLEHRSEPDDQFRWNPNFTVK